ncbi:MAG: PEGA domain-containing protein [Candidatus Taylorbacteria bacterium]|nr:PEGA domain-containing protein [Candidatus Taylorbacteria bacterium]
MKIFFKLFWFLLAAVPFAVFAQNQSPCSSSASIIDTSQAQPGIIFVISNSAQANFTITNTVTQELIYKGSGYGGYAWSREGVTAGTYTITWGAVSGCGTPPSETKTTDTRGSIAFVGNYKDISTPAPSTTGTIDIRTNLLQSSDREKITFIITGPQNKTITANEFTWFYAPVGTYTITYSGEIEGYNAPAPQTKTLSANGSITFQVDYALSQTTLPLTVDSFPAGATVYVDEVLVGKAPVVKKVSRGATHRIRCTLPGYNDYVYNYVVAPFSSTVNVVKGDWRCLFTVKNGQANPTLSPTNVQQQPQQVLPSTKQPLLQEGNTLPSATPQTLPPQKPKGFFYKFWHRILSLFGKM